MADTIVTNSPDTGGGSAEPADTTNINVTIPTPTDNGNTNP